MYCIVIHIQMFLQDATSNYKCILDLRGMAGHCDSSRQAAGPKGLVHPLLFFTRENTDNIISIHKKAELHLYHCTYTHFCF